uniref:Uncharacterized protein n=1 Tax=Populus alba TaxID=43335 RepID=A0A4U5P3L4_POPAL|nr:hypothetical protein D5086_0000230740 [Populus alba]
MEWHGIAAWLADTGRRQWMFSDFHALFNYLDLVEQGESLRASWSCQNKPHSSNDAQRKLHSCPLLLIRKSVGTKRWRRTVVERNTGRSTVIKAISPWVLVEEDVQDAHRKNHGKSMNERYLLEGSADFVPDRKERITKSPREGRSYASAESVCHDSIYKCRNVASKLTEEERAGKLWEMQVDAELHEEKRWKHLRKLEEDGA